MQQLILAITVALAPTPVLAAHQGSEAATAVLNAYIEIQGHLAADRFGELKAPARTLGSNAKALGKPGEGIVKAAAAIESAVDLKAAREAFGPLSDEVIRLVQSDSSIAQGDLRLGYCPMVKRSWVQREPQVRNPYYGSQMANCGELKPLKK